MEKITILGYGASLVICLFRPGQKMDTGKWLGEDSPLNGSLEKKKFIMDLTSFVSKLQVSFFSHKAYLSC